MTDQPFRVQVYDARTGVPLGGAAVSLAMHAPTFFGWGEGAVRVVTNVTNDAGYAPMWYGAAWEWVDRLMVDLPGYYHWQTDPSRDATAQVVYLDPIQNYATTPTPLPPVAPPPTSPAVPTTSPVGPVGPVGPQGPVDTFATTGAFLLVGAIGLAGVAFVARVRPRR